MPQHNHQHHCISIERFVTISDLHFIKEDQNAAKIFKNFFNLIEEKEIKNIFFLGDIFDFFLADYKVYDTEFELFFRLLKDFLSKSSSHKFYYVEGNHDLHLRKIFLRHFDKNQFELTDKAFYIESGGIKFRLSHGDEFESGNYIYKIYRKAVSFKIAEYVAHLGLMQTFLYRWGKFESERSRQRRYRYSEEILNLIKNKFREGLLNFIKKEGPQEHSDVYIGGHSHILEDYSFTVGNKMKRYLNNGLSLKEQKVIIIEKGQVTWCSVSTNCKLESL